MSVIYVEHLSHYMGDQNNMITFTDKEFNELIEKAKECIKSKKNGNDNADDDFDDYLEEVEEKKGRQFALGTALLNFFESPRRPSTISTALKKKGVWSGEWEEGSYAFGKTKKKAQNAVIEIETKYLGMDW